MLPFSTAEYKDVLSGQRLRFPPGSRNGGVVWTGEGWEKVGTWKRALQGEKEVLVITYNFAREETFLLTVIAVENGAIAAFRLTGRHDGKWEFRV
ncbi:hypothetical protein [Chitinophaga rhizosphaerae]|uniref:hypothetical protein n=1 Tax=Chitinophaga rhizosphaerae TaxID=1864947 RepID=UPI000F7FBAD3|nr:hypothetical protein [Chitinophaga rhizosphaerae]